MHRKRKYTSGFICCSKSNIQLYVALKCLISFAVPIIVQVCEAKRVHNFVLYCWSYFCHKCIQDADQSIIVVHFKQHITFLFVD